MSSRIKLAGAAAVVLLTAACGSTSSGGTTSAGAGGTTQPSSSAALVVATTPLGSILTTGAGKTIYMFAADKDGKSSCSGSCLRYWPIVPAPASTTPPPGVTATLGVLTRDDGTKQLTVAGMPVYTFSGDTSAGATTGQGQNTSGGLWWVLSSGGTIIKATAGGTSPTPSVSKSKSGGGYGY